MTAPAPGNVTSAGGTSGTTITVATPAGATADTTLLAWFTCPDNVSLANMAGPAGWLTLTPNGPQESGPPRGKWIMRPRGASAPAASYAFAKPSGSLGHVTLMAIHGVDPDAPVNAAPAWATDATAAGTLAAPSRTTTTDDCLLIAGWAATPYQSGHQNNAWSGTVANTDGTAPRQIAYQAHLVAWQARPTAGATGTRTATFNNTSGGSVGKLASMLALAGVQATGQPATIDLDTVYSASVVPPMTVVAATPPPPPRTYPITVAERAELLEALEIDYELHRVLVLNELDEPVGDVADQVTACTIEYNADGPIDQIIKLDLTAELDWGRERLQPFMRVTGGGWVDDVSMGVFPLTAPKPDATRRPQLYSVQGFDKLYLLHHRIRGVVSFPAGVTVLGAVSSVLTQRGFGEQQIDPTRAGDVLREARSWSREQGEVTWLVICNELLSMVGYGPLWVDREGRARSSPIVPADQRPTAWRYDTTSQRGIVHLDDQDVDDDYTSAPNEWEVYANWTDRDAPPTPGDGIFYFRNDTEGRSSVQARGGLVITRPETVEAATQADLEAQGWRMVAEDMHSTKELRFASRLNPYHQPRDVLEYVNPGHDVASRVEQVGYTHDLVAPRTIHVVRTIAGAVYG